MSEPPAEYRVADTPLLLTIDSSVFLNAFNPREPGYADSHHLLQWLQKLETPLIEPTLLLAEVAATLARNTPGWNLASHFANSLSELPHMVLVPLDLKLGRSSAEIAATQFLRGADAVFVAVARRFGATLVSLDRQQRERAAAVVTTCTPADLLLELGHRRADA